MISFNDHERVIDDLVSGLLHPRFPTSWNVVLPPVFDDAELESEMGANPGLQQSRRENLVVSRRILPASRQNGQIMGADMRILLKRGCECPTICRPFSSRDCRAKWDLHPSEIATELGRRTPAPLVAILSSDVIKTPIDFVEKLYLQWSVTTRLPKLPKGIAPDAALHRLLMSVPSDRPVVQILRRFHKILDSLDQWVLASIRNAEQANKLRTLTISPFEYEELKRRWEQRGKLLIASDYGDAHSVKTVELVPAKSIETICKSRSVPGHVAELAFRLTGGYPLPFKGVVEEWIRLGQPTFTRDVISRLHATAEQRMVPLVRQIDVPGETRYRDAVIELSQGKTDEAEDAFHALSRHPWNTLLLSDDGLRAEALARASVDAAIKGAASERSDVSLVADVMARATGLYRRRQYSTTIQLIDTSSEARYRPPYLRLLWAHAQVMATLYGIEDHEAGVDTDWKGLRLKVDESRRTLALLRDKVRMYAEIEKRYDDLSRIADSILNATKDGSRRVVDILAGCATDSAPVDPRTALLLLLLKLESSRAISGDASACHAILALPEQVFRIWAIWNLRLTYYKVPEGHGEIWTEVERAWPHGTFARPSAGAPFTSFESFAYFAIAMSLHRADTSSTLPETSFKSLTQALSTLDVRRDSAHALTIPGRKVRAQLFSLVDRWFDTLLPSCEAHREAISRDELLARVEPLPIVGEENSTIWR